MKPAPIIRVYRPELTDEERARRMALIHDATVQMVQAWARAKALKGVTT